MGYTAVAPGQTITAAQMNLVMGQSQMRFANAAQRSTQLPSPVLGMLSWLDDTQQIETYRGGSWKPVGTQRHGYGTSSASQSIPNASWTTVTMGTFTAPANTVGRATWTSDGRVKVPWAGAYLVQGMVSFPSNPTGQRVVEVQTSPDGATWTRAGVIGAHTEIPAVAVATVTMSVSGSLFLPANGYLKMLCYQDSGAAMSLISGQSGMSLVLLGAD